jgi:hypothetical protein
LLVVLIARRPSGNLKVIPAVPHDGTIEITTSPPGATVFVNGKPSGTAMTALPLSMASGAADIEARMPGYRTAKTTVNLAGGARLTVPLALVPVLALKLSFPSEGRVAIDNEEPVVRDGQFFRDFPVGTYSVKLGTGRGTLAFAFEVRPEGPAVITGPPRAKDFSALLISNFGDQTRIYTSASSVDVKLDGKALGQLGEDGLELPKLTPASYKLELGAGKDLRKYSIEIGPERTLTAIVDSDPNTGTLLVQTNEEDVEIRVLLNGTEVKHGNSRKGTLRVANLKAGKYLVRAAKEGYDADNAEQPAEVQKREDKTVSFQFRRQPLPASVSIRLTPGSELFIDGISKGITQEDTRVVGNLKAIRHTFRAEKGKQFQPSQKPLELTAGQTSDLDLRLTVSPVPVDIKKLPPDSTVTYTRAGDKTVYPFIGTHQDLPEGDYTFTADAEGYSRQSAIEHISWNSVRPIDLTQAAAPASYNKMADWGKGVWMEKPRYSERDGGGFVLFPKPLGYVQFTVRWQGGKIPAQWLLHYVNEKDYIKCEIGDDGFRAVRVSETKNPEVLASKKGVPKSSWYDIRISIRPDGATLNLQNGKASEPLGEVVEPGFAETKFGFYVQDGQQLYLADFFGRSFR